MANLYEHGDMVLAEVAELPKGLKASKSRVLLEGKSNTHSHRGGGKWFPHASGPFVIGYLVAKNTTLTHKEHGEAKEGDALRVAKIKDGIYEVRRQNELTHEGMRPVVD